MNFDQIFTEVCFQGLNQQYSSIGSGNGLVPTRRQAIVWTNDGKFADAYMSLGLNELMPQCQQSNPEGYG